jgi:hypothetical protein
MCHGRQEDLIIAIFPEEFVMLILLVKAAIPLFPPCSSQKPYFSPLPFLQVHPEWLLFGVGLKCSPPAPVPGVSCESFTAIPSAR